MNKAEHFIQQRLQRRKEDGSFRQLKTLQLSVDFCSNDYLGFSRSPELKRRIELLLTNSPSYLNGSGGSRLLSGNSAFAEETEAFIAEFHHAESGLMFNSGYDANIGLLSSLAQKGDTFIMDELIHASLIDGARLTHANRYTFRHNDLCDLETKLKAAKGTVYIVVESVYSMDGDLAPLTEISQLGNQYDAALIVDEAHALGIFGTNGNGLVQQLKLEDKVFARVVTFGKALGCHGAIVLGSLALRNYLINFARSFIYTTALPFHSIAAIQCAYQELTAIDYTLLVQQNISLYTALTNRLLQHNNTSQSAIQTIIYKSGQQTKSAAQLLQSKNLDVRAILSPTVPQGKERLRICLHTFNTVSEIELLVTELKNLKNNE